MAEQTVRRRTEPEPRTPADRATGSGPSLGEYRESIRQAQSCLDAAGKRLRRAEAEQADEVLNLLRAATSYLQQALSPPDGTVLSGAE